MQSLRLNPILAKPQTLKGKVDTGAAGNILPMRTYKQIFPQRVSSKGLPLNTTPSNATLTDYHGRTIEQYGTITMPCNYLDDQQH